MDMKICEQNLATDNLQNVIESRNLGTFSYKMKFKRGNQRKKMTQRAEEER
jgi:hypothetical protein